MAALMMKARTLIFLLVFIVLQICKNNTTWHTITLYFDPVVNVQIQDINVAIIVSIENEVLVRKEGRKEGTCLFDINIKHNTEILIGKNYIGRLPLRHSLCRYRGSHARVVIQNTLCKKMIQILKHESYSR